MAALESFMETNRQWQSECLGAFMNAVHNGKRDWLVTATPGAGKTRFGFMAARALADEGLADYVHAVAPTRLIRSGWERAGKSCGFDLHHQPNGALPELGDIATSYAQVAAEPAAHAAATRRRRALVVLDEIHHAGEHRAWGQALESAFGADVIRLELSGTCFREDEARIPFITYGPDGVCRADYPYSYGRALADGVCRPVSFVPVKQSVTFRGHATDEQRSEVLQASIGPQKGIIRDLVTQADVELSRRRLTWPDAAGLLLARDQASAWECAAIVEEICGERPAVVISDNASAESDLLAFQRGAGRWLVAVRMVSEGVDIPRLMVGVYATNITASLFFRQFVGRVIRVRDAAAEETATIFIPNDGRLEANAADIDAEVRQQPRAGVPSNRGQPRAGEPPSSHKCTVSYRRPSWSRVR
jgi:superfamily II DNA or RNA helicase